MLTVGGIWVEVYREIGGRHNIGQCHVIVDHVRYAVDIEVEYGNVIEPAGTALSKRARRVLFDPEHRKRIINAWNRIDPERPIGENQ